MSKKLGEIFVENKISTQDQIDECLYLQQQDRNAKPLGYYLLQKKYLNPDALWKFVNERENK